MRLKCGVVMYTGIAPRTLAALAHETEEAGWDGFFIWDTFLSDNAWVLLAAAAMETERVHLGTMLTAPSRRRPCQLASEVATRDRLSIVSRTAGPFSRSVWERPKTSDLLGFAPNCWTRALIF
jgi:hypothetical protein